MEGSPTWLCVWCCFVQLLLCSYTFLLSQADTLTVDCVFFYRPLEFGCFLPINWISCMCNFFRCRPPDGSSDDHLASQLEVLTCSVSCRVVCKGIRLALNCQRSIYCLLSTSLVILVQNPNESTVSYPRTFHPLLDPMLIVPVSVAFPRLRML